MFKESISSGLVLAGAILFNLIFWEEEMGLNMLLFSFFIVGALWYLQRERFAELPVKVAAGGVLLTALLVVWRNSVLANFIHILSIPVLVGLVHVQELRFLGYTFWVFGANLLNVPHQIIQRLFNLFNRYAQEKQGFSPFRRLKTGLFALLTVPVFYLLYYVANPKFAQLSDTFWSKIFWFFNFDWNWGRIVFFFFGTGIVGAILWRTGWTYFLDKVKQSELPDTLNAEDYKEGETHSFFQMDRTDKYRNSLLLLAALNGLLLLNNVLDLGYVWFNSSPTQSAWELKQYVHEGTYFLIVAILLAIAVLAYLFRGALNFYAEGRILRGLAFAWLAQNAFLALSVGCRNWRYIDHCGLAYKRIGVFIFLLMTLSGLYFLYLKIRDKKSFFFVLRRTSWAFYGILIGASFVNWDVFISAYNIKTPIKSGVIDAPFLIYDVSSKNLPLLYEYQNEIKAKLPHTTELLDNRYTLSEAEFDQRLVKKTENFLKHQSLIGFMSWNASDAYVLNYLKSKGLTK